MKRLTINNVLRKTGRIVLLLYSLVLIQFQFAVAKERFDFSDQFVSSEFELFVSKLELEKVAIKNFYTERSFNSFWYGNAENIAQLSDAFNKSFLHGLLLPLRNKI